MNCYFMSPDDFYFDIMVRILIFSILQLVFDSDRFRNVMDIFSIFF